MTLIDIYASRKEFVEVIAVPSVAGIVGLEYLLAGAGVDAERIFGKIVDVADGTEESLVFG